MPDQVYIAVGLSESNPPTLCDEKTIALRSVSSRTGPARAAIRAFNQVLRQNGEVQGIVLVETPPKTRRPVHVFTISLPFGEKLSTRYLHKCCPQQVHYQWMSQIQHELRQRRPPLGDEHEPQPSSETGMKMPVPRYVEKSLPTRAPSREMPEENSSRRGGDDDAQSMYASAMIQRRREQRAQARR